MTLKKKFSLGLVGRCTTEEDQIKYDIPVGTLWWLPTDDEPNVWFEFMLPDLKTHLANI